VVRPLFDLADIVRRHRAGLEEVQALSPTQGRALSAISLCRTAALGGHVNVCPGCAWSEAPSYNSCRNRHCPKCQNLAQERWIAGRSEAILPVPHFHGVLTLPEDLRPLARRHPREILGAMFRCAQAAFLELGQARLGVTLGLTLVLHTWTRDLRFHPHVHVLVTAGGLTPDGERFRRAQERFLLPVKPLARLFRGKMLAALRGLREEGRLALSAGAFGTLMASLARQNWVAYLKRAFRSPQWVLQYLGRYTHRVGIANSRLVNVTETEVTFRTKCGRQVTLAPIAFLQRFLLHILPERFKKIRHAGLYASPKGLARARACLPRAPLQPARKPPTWEQALLSLTGRDVTCCRNCGASLVRLVLPGRRCPRSGMASSAARSPP
jgi:hypothetical protein